MEFLVHHLLRRTARTHPSEIALVDGDQAVRYEEFWEQAQLIAVGLRELGVQPHDRVGVFLPACIDQAIAIFAISTVGAVFVPIHESRTPHQVGHIVNDCQIRCLFTIAPKWKRISEFASEWDSVQSIVLASGSSRRTSADVGSINEKNVNLHFWSDLQANVRVSSATPLSETAIGRDLAAILYTSGSTGAPKGVMLSHDNVLAGTSIVADYLGITANDRILAALPFSFDAGLNQLMTAVQVGGSTVLTNFILAKQLVKALTEFEITGLAGVPTLWNLLAASRLFRSTTFPHLRYITNTGGAMPQSTLTVLRDTLPTSEIFLMYGLTEAFRSTYLPPDQLDRRPDSIGKAIPNTQIMVISEDGNLCPPGEIGELVHRGPTVTLGYWGKPELTRQFLKPDPASRLGSPSEPLVCYSGDLVHMDDDGFLFFEGRRDHQIKSAGFRISPNEVEEVLMQASDVQQAAVIGIPNDLLGEHIEAFVVRSASPPEESSPAGATTESMQQKDNNRCDSDDDGQAFCERLRAAASRLLPSYMVPQSIHLVSQLPLTSSHKIDYATLKAQRLAAIDQASNDSSS